MLVLKGLHRTVQLQLLQHYWSRHRLGCDIEWFALETNRDDCVIFEIAFKYCISRGESVPPDGTEITPPRREEGSTFSACLI